MCHRPEAGELPQAPPVWHRRWASHFAAAGVPVYLCPVGIIGASFHAPPWALDLHERVRVEAALHTEEAFVVMRDAFARVGGVAAYRALVALAGERTVFYDVVMAANRFPTLRTAPRRHALEYVSTADGW